MNKFNIVLATFLFIPLSASPGALGPYIPHDSWYPDEVYMTADVGTASYDLSWFIPNFQGIGEGHVRIHTSWWHHTSLTDTPPYPSSWFGGIGAGFEIDFAVNENFLKDCSSITNLPNGYDDCVTAGYLEGDSSAYGCGSFTAQYYDSEFWNFWEVFNSPFQDGAAFVCDIQFYTKGSLRKAFYGVYSQNVYRRWCQRPNDVWCMGSAESKIHGEGAIETNANAELIWQNGYSPVTYLTRFPIMAPIIMSLTN